jgi:hypothetical protein
MYYVSSWRSIYVFLIHGEIWVTDKITKQHCIFYLFADDGSFLKVHFFMRSIRLRAMAGILLKASFASYFRMWTKNRFLSWKPSYICIIQHCYKKTCAKCMQMNMCKYSPWVLENVAIHRTMNAWTQKPNNPTEHCMHVMLHCGSNKYVKIVTYC